ncbi:hypothetical protein [Sphaerimonospora thailandensis]|uniref:hypothetical protein n=1 Tax=Sphaerimonospora thailandensis TaxID=795644 RepID=UPI00389A0F8A
MARVSKQGIQAEPIVIGRRRKAEAVLISFELYEKLADLIDEIQLASLIRERLATAERTPDLTLEEVAESLGIDIEEQPGQDEPAAGAAGERRHPPVPGGNPQIQPAAPCGAGAALPQPAGGGAPGG